MKIKEYNRISATDYAKIWALSRNPEYYNFDKIGGDCTNFASQCVFAGCKTMNFNKIIGWYYNSINDRAPAWSGAEYFRNFLLSNSGVGPFGAETALEIIRPGDIISLNNSFEYYHTLIVCDVSGDVPLVCAHSDDSFMRRLDTYYYHFLSPIHISGYKK